jgi:NAD-dependent deacetylase sirtuin 5
VLRAETRRQDCRAANAVPNEAHYAIVRASFAHLRGPAFHPNVKITFITQNVDGLSPRAMQAVQTSTSEAPDATYLEMHGSVWELICTTCKTRAPDFSSPVAPSLAGTECFDLATGPEPVIPTEDLPHCALCTKRSTRNATTGLLRPGTVWFGQRSTLTFVCS